jgi:hypothetical protein
VAGTVKTGQLLSFDDGVQTTLVSWTEQDHVHTHQAAAKSNPLSGVALLPRIIFDVPRSVPVSTSQGVAYFPANTIGTPL